MEVRVMTARYWIDTLCCADRRRGVRPCAAGSIAAASRGAVRQTLPHREPAGRRRGLVCAHAGVAAAVWAAGIQPGSCHGATGIAGVALYKGLKRVVVRERPFITHSASHSALRRWIATAFHRATRCTRCRSPGRQLPPFRNWAGFWFHSLRRSPLRASCSVCTIRPTCWRARPSARCSPAWDRPLPDVRVLFISDVYFPRVNGVSTSIRTFRNDLGACGIETQLIAPDYGMTMCRTSFAYRARACHEILKIAACVGGALQRALGQFKRDAFDLVHIHTPFVAHYAGTRFARRAGIPCVATYHTFFEEYLHHYVPVIPRGMGRLARASFHTLAM